MKKYFQLLLTLAFLSSCSAPKYTYHFDHYDYNSGKKGKSLAEQKVAVEPTTQPSILTLDEKTLTASVNESGAYVPPPAPTLSREEAIAKINSMSKEERKELKKEVKKFVRKNKKEIKNGTGTKQLDNDVKLASIFGAVGIVLLIIGGDVLYVIGALALLVGLYFFIRWLIHQ